MSTTAQTTPAKEVSRLALTASRQEFKNWRMRLCGYLGREKPDLAVFLSGDQQPSQAVNASFACHLLQFLGDDVLELFGTQLDPIKAGVDLFRAIVGHFEAAAPPEDTAEEIFLQGFYRLKRDKFSSINDYMRETNALLLHVERTSGDKAPNLERVLVMHTLQQLCQGHYCPWAHGIKAKYVTAMREVPSLSRTGAVSFQQLMSDVSAYTSAGSSQSVPGSSDRRYESRTQCTKCKRFGHTADRCRGKQAGVSAVSADQDDDVPRDSATLPLWG